MNHQVKTSWHDILEQGVTLRLNDVETADLSYRAAEGVLSPALLNSLRFYKESLCNLLRPGSDYLPLSPTQKRMWLLCRTNPGNPFYNMALTTEFSGELNTHALIQAMTELPQRHAALRAIFPVVDGQPIQEIVPVDAAVSDIEFIDLSGQDPAQQQARVKELAGAIATKAFNIEEGPLWIARLLRLEPNRHTLLFNIHHLLGDRWSIRLLFNDVTYYYAQYSGQKPRRAYLTPPSYIDFILWQQTWLHSEECDRQIRYWQQKLQGIGALACLPLKRHYQKPLNRRGGNFSLHVSQQHLQRLQKLVHETDTTLFTVLLGAFKILIRQCCGMDDVRVGSPVANRNRFVTRRAVAMLADNILLRTDFANVQTFREAVARTKQTVEEAMLNQNVAFDQVTAGTPLGGVSAFEVYFALLNISEKVAFPGLEVHTVQNETGTAKIDLAVRIREEADGLHVDFIYDADMIEPASVEQIAVHYGRLLETIAANFDIELCALPFDESLRTVTPIQSDKPQSLQHHSTDDEPRDELERQLAAIWKELLQVPRVGIRDDFFTLGGHSLLAVRLLDTVEKATGKTLSLAIFFQAPTIEGQAALLRNEDLLDHPSLVALQPHGACPPLFCIDGAVRYRALAETLAPDQPVYGLIPANPTDGQWYSFDKIGERATHYLEIIKKVQPQGPYQLAGLSFAGLVALMIAKQLREAGEEVHLLALFDTYGPGYFAMPFSRRVGLHLHALRKLDLSARAQYLRDRARLRLLKKPHEPKAAAEQQQTPEDAWQVDVFDRELSPEEINHLRTMAQHLRQDPSIARYEGKTVLFIARDKPMEFLQADATLGWSGFASNLTLHQVAGDHTSLIQEPNVSDLVALLRPALYSSQELDEK